MILSLDLKWKFEPTWKNFIAIDAIFGQGFSEVIHSIQLQAKGGKNDSPITPNQVLNYLEYVSGKRMVPADNEHVTFAAIDNAYAKLLTCLLIYAQPDKQFKDYLEGKLDSTNDEPKKKVKKSITTKT